MPIVCPALMVFLLLLFLVRFEKAALRAWKYFENVAQYFVKLFKMFLILRKKKLEISQKYPIDDRR